MSATLGALRSKTQKTLNKDQKRSLDDILMF